MKNTGEQDPNENLEIRLDDIPEATEHPEVTIKRNALEKVLMADYEYDLTDRECMIIDVMNDIVIKTKKIAEHHLEEAEKTMRVLSEKVESEIGFAREELNIVGDSEVFGEVIQDQLRERELERRKRLTREAKEFME